MHMDKGMNEWKSAMFHYSVHWDDPNELVGILEYSLRLPRLGTTHI